MIVVTFLNQKGGVGKTSSVYHLAGALSRAGRRVLLIDNDPQASLTQGFLGPDGMLAIPPESSIAALYEPDADPIPESLIMPTSCPAVCLIPGSIHLTRSNKMPDEAWGERQDGLRRFLTGLDGFDLALIDCPPNLHLCSWAALCASSQIVVPVQCEDFGSQGLAPVHDSIEAVRSGPNPSLELSGYLLTMFDKRLTIHLAYESLLREAYGPDVFEHPIPRAKDFIEAVAARQPLAFHKPRSAPAKAVAAVADELLERIGLAGSLEQQSRGAA